MKDWKPALAGLVIAAGLLSGCSAATDPSPSQKPSASSRDADRSRQAESCAGDVKLVASTGQTETITRERSPEFAVHIGDTLRVEAMGRCGDKVRLAPGSGLDPMSSGQQFTTAIKAGTTRLDLYHAMCDEHPELEECYGGVTTDGTAKIVISP